MKKIISILILAFIIGILLPIKTLAGSNISSLTIEEGQEISAI